jgi:hypothetical protein
MKYAKWLRQWQRKHVEVRGTQPPQARRGKPHNGKRISRGVGMHEDDVWDTRRFVVVGSSSRHLWGVGNMLISDSYCVELPVVSPL